VKNFGTIVVADFEFELEGGDYNLQVGDLPVPLCMVAYVLDEHLQHVRTVRMWRDEFMAARRPPFNIGDDDVFVAYAAQAELTCFKVLGWPFPKHIFDLHTAYLSVSNILLPYDPDEKRTRPRKRLSDACRAYGIEGWENIDKAEISKDIGEGNWRKYGCEAVFHYCEEDVRMTTRLLPAMLRGRPGVFPPVDTDRVLHWSNYSAKTVALIQARGMPIDVMMWNLVQENKAAVVTELLRRLDPSQGTDYPIYSPEGEWSYARFERWLAYIGVIAWPRLDSGALDLEGDTFRMMSHIPGIEGLHALRDSLRVIVGSKLPIGRDGRNRPSLFPFGTVTGRNAHRKSLYNAHAGMRGFMLFPIETIGCYLDWRSQEVGVAAERSDDKALMTAYRGDVYHSLAHMCGLTSDLNIERWKKTSAGVRQRMKSLQLAITYGIGVPSLARGLNRHPLIASEIILRHQHTYPRFWEWRAGMVDTAMLARRIESAFGWPLRITTSPNERTLYNFPMQSGGGEMLRLAAWRLCEAGIIPCMLVHDGILFEETNPERIEHAKEIMRAAGRDVCGGFEIDVDVDQMLVGGARYRDKRPVAQKMWAAIEDVLMAIGALKRRA
jgi:hypothetical protein